MHVICDIETDDLDPKEVWVIVTKELDSGRVDIFKNPARDAGERRRFVEYAGGVTRWIGHNFLKFDYLKVLRKFFPEVRIDPLAICDTLICSRLFNYGADGGHSLEAWGVRVGRPKPKYSDWQGGLTDEMIHRCVEDVEINYLLYRFLEKHINKPSLQSSILLEHKMEYICYDMQRVGFHFDKVEAEKLRDEIEVELAKLDKEIQECFPPKSELVRTVKPKLTKKGTLSLTDFRWLGVNDEPIDLSPYSADAPFSVFEYVPFNPASPAQVVERLNEAGWRPFDKTKGHLKTEQLLRRTRNKSERAKLEDRLKDYKVYGWSINEDNLDTLPDDAPEGARKLAQRILLASRRSVLTEWLNAFREATNRIHGSFNGLGAWTHRMNHQKPNAGNIPTNPDVKDKNNPTPVEQWKLKYSKTLRALWGVPPKRRLVGVDADGIQLRILAHYMQDKDFTEALVNGKKEDQTDAHSLNARKLGFNEPAPHRDKAKTFIYAYILGAGVDKIAQILHTNNKDAREKQTMFTEGYPGLVALKREEIPEVGKKGYFIGLDGRIVAVPSEHHVLAGYLQNGEQLVMKTANVDWRAKLKNEKVDFLQVNFVHDEWVTEVPDDDELAEYVMAVQKQSIVDAGITLKIRCPLLGTGQQGYNWSDVH